MQTTPDQERISAYEEYKEAMQSIRHYSQLRFTQLTVYSAINAALIYTVFQSKIVQTGTGYRIVLCLVGLAFALVFLTVEIALDSYKCSSIPIVEKLNPNGHWSLRPKQLGIFVRLPIRALYALSSLFWIYVLIAPFL